MGTVTPGVRTDDLLVRAAFLQPSFICTAENESQTNASTWSVSLKSALRSSAQGIYERRPRRGGWNRNMPCLCWVHRLFLDGWHHVIMCTKKKKSQKQCCLHAWLLKRVLERKRQSLGGQNAAVEATSFKTSTFGKTLAGATSHARGHWPVDSEREKIPAPAPQKMLIMEWSWKIPTALFHHLSSTSLMCTASTPITFYRLSPPSCFSFP